MKNDCSLIDDFLFMYEGRRRHQYNKRLRAIIAIQNPDRWGSVRVKLYGGSRQKCAK